MSDTKAAETPRTDAFHDDHIQEWSGDEFDNIRTEWYAFASQIERELAASQARCAELERDAAVYREAFDHIAMHMHDMESAPYICMPMNEWYAHSSVLSAFAHGKSALHRGEEA